MEKRNMILAMFLSVVWSGLGLIYAEKVKEGIALALLAVLFQYLNVYKNHIFGIVVFIIWIYSLYATYKQVKEFNGE